MICFYKINETNEYIYYDFSSTSPGKIKINKSTKEIVLLDYGDEDSEELIFIIKKYVIENSYPTQYTYAWC